MWTGHGDGVAGSVGKRVGREWEGSRGHLVMPRAAPVPAPWEEREDSHGVLLLIVRPLMGLVNAPPHVRNAQIR